MKSIQRKKTVFTTSNANAAFQQLPSGNRFVRIDSVGRPIGNWKESIQLTDINLRHPRQRIYTRPLKLHIRDEILTIRIDVCPGAVHL